MAENSKLMRMRQDAGLTTKQVAEKAGLPLRVVYQAEIGVAVEDEVATKILHAMMQLTNKVFTRADTEINIKEPEKWRVVRGYTRQ